MSLSPAELAKAMSAAERWAAQDPDRATKSEIEALLNLIPLGDDEAAAAVVHMFGKRLSFGTAGLRGELGAGPSRMNRMVVQQTSAGFADFLLQRARAGETSNAPSVVIGFDARVNSDVFARDAAEVFAGAGLRAILLPGPLPTPITAFAVRHFDASAGIMITASHNPPKDNGYKVFLGDADEGSQIAAPADALIAEHIEAVASRPLSAITLSREYELVGQEIVEAYVEATASAVAEHAPAQSPHSSDFRIVYTALHGVGSEPAQAVFARAGFPSVTVVEQQDQPNGSFPTVAFPNPEEPGALDLAYETAREVGADLIVAHDPDADRLAVALPDNDAPAGFRRLTGNQLGLILGWHAAERYRASGASGGALACTIVSSPALSAVAQQYDLGYEETLSGFKWVSRVPGLIFGFEEALGYLTRPELVRDKDGISASADLIALALELHNEGKTLWDHLDDAAERFGCFASSQITVRLASPEAVVQRAQEIRENPPASFGEVAVKNMRDLLVAGNSAVPANVLRFDLSDGSRVMIRPSGTEPKLKVYLDTFSDQGTAKQRCARAEKELEVLEAATRAILKA